VIVNTKTFYAVGQGGFYSEALQYENLEECKKSSYTIVYDCGSVGSKRQKLVPSINNSGLKSVGCVVISHLDQDHINGLKELEMYLSAANTDAPLLILPKPTPLDLLILFGESSDQVVDYFFHLQKCSKILFVTNDKVENDPIILENIQENKVVSHNTLITLFNAVDETQKWQLKFYVDEENYEKILDENQQNFIKSIKTISDFHRKEKGFDKTNKARLKELYEKIRGAVNGSSMAMISAPFSKDVQNRNAERDCGGPYISWMNGDICLNDNKKVNAIEKHFNEFLSLNVDFQVPHHGSENNLVRSPKVNGRRAYVWYGTYNKYGHPSTNITNMLENDGFLVNRITEKSNNIIRQEIWV